MAKRKKSYYAVSFIRSEILPRVIAEVAIKFPTEALRDQFVTSRADKSGAEAVPSHPYPRNVKMECDYDGVLHPYYSSKTFIHVEMRLTDNGDWYFPEYEDENHNKLDRQSA